MDRIKKRIRRYAAAVKNRLLRLKHRSDTEHVQALIRLPITAALAIYLSFSPHTHTVQTLWGDRVAWGYFFSSFVFFGWVAFDIRPSVTRRTLTMFLDHFALSVFLALEGARGAPLYLIYLWVSLGNGFRYGVRPLILSTALSTIGFTTVILVSDFWHSILSVAVGLDLTLVAIPAYAASLVKQLTEAKATAEEASRAKSRFLATASHELRTPLHAIIGLSDLIRQTKLTAEQAEMIQTVNSSGRTLLALVEDVLDLSSVEAGKLVSNMVEFDLHNELADALAIVKPQVMAKHLDLSVSIDPNTPYMLKGDWLHTRQVLINLITNAIKFTDRGGITLKVGLLDTVGDTAHIRFDICDTGIGIKPEDIGRIFESFAQVNESSTRRHGGVGLGLAIVRQIAHLMNGEISVRSEVGQGSTFTVDLPFTIHTRQTFVEPLGSVILISQNEQLASLVSSLSGKVLVPETKVIAETTDSALSFVHESDGPIAVIVDGHDYSERELEALSAKLLQTLRSVPCALILISNPTHTVQTAQKGFASIIDDASNIAALASGIQIGFRFAVRREIEDNLRPRDMAVLMDVEDDAFPLDTFQPLEGAARILMVEDSPVNRMVTSKILRSAGYDVAMAATADAALDFLAEENFDLILLDLNMPGTSGLDILKLYRVMRMDEPMPPVVIFSADVTEESRRECDEVGIDLFLPKPIEPSVLLAKLGALLPKHASLTNTTAEKAIVPEVTSIASHPRFKSNTDVHVIDRKALETLAGLDSDPAFLANLIQEFETDTRSLLAEIDQTVIEKNSRAFWDAIHAMRSSAANIGAKQLFTACIEINTAGRGSFNHKAADYAERLHHEFDRFCKAVNRFIAAQQRSVS